MAKVRSGYAILKDTHPMWQSIVYGACSVEYAGYAEAPPLRQDIGVKRHSNPLYRPGGGQWGDRCITRTVRIVFISLLALYHVSGVKM